MQNAENEKQEREAVSESQELIDGSIIDHIEAKVIEVPPLINPGQKEGLSWGQMWVGVDFNPGGDERVAKIKALCAELSDLVNEEVYSKEDGLTMQGSLLASQAQLSVLEAQMMCVKFVTFKY